MGNLIETIGYLAFYLCELLKSISLPNSLLTIDDEAFAFCRALTTINIPRNVNTIGINPFLGCDELTSISISESNENYAVYNEEYCFLYEIKTNKIISYPLSQTQKSITIPNSIKIIGDSAFYGCDSIETLNFGSVQTIGASSFCVVNHLKTIIFGNSFETIGSSAFLDCRFLENVSLPNSLLTIGSYAFERCNSLTAINIPQNVKTIGSNPFLSCDKLTSITVTEGNENYAVYNEEYCFLYELKTNKIISYALVQAQRIITIPNLFKIIGDSAFSYCDSILTISLRSVQTIESNTFYSCGSLRSINFGDSIETIGSEAFYSCELLTSISLPDSLLTIGDQAFSFCNKLTTINIPQNVKIIGINPFLGCDELTSISISESNENYAVYDQEICFLYEIKTNKIISYPLGQTQRNITIPNSIKTIGSRAFSSCSSLQTINLGSIQTIELTAFSNCHSLNEIFFYGYNEPDILSNAFLNCPETLKVYVLKNYPSETFGEFPVNKIIPLPPSKLSHTSKNKQPPKTFFFMY